MKSYAVNKYKEDYDVYIGRGTKWGNPYTHQDLEGTKADYQTTTREDAISKYEDYLRGNEELLGSIDELVGKRLGCFCKPQDCHGDILSKVANSIDELSCIMIMKKKSILFTRDYVSSFFIWLYEKELLNIDEESNYEIKFFAVDKDTTDIFKTAEIEGVETSKLLSKLTGIDELSILDAFMEVYE